MRHNCVLFALALIGLTTWLGFMGPHATSAPAVIGDHRSPRQVAASTLSTPESLVFRKRTCAPVCGGINFQNFFDSRGGRTSALSKQHHARVSDAYGKLPLQFEINEGQSDARVKFLARGSGYNLFLTGAEAVLALSKSTAADAMETEPAADGISTAGRHKRVRSEAQARTRTRTVVRMRLLGANPAPNIKGQDQLPGKVNYFVGNDSAKWRAGIATYARVGYQGVYPGVDVVYYGNQRQLENDFVVAPGVDPGVIALAFEGAQEIAIGKAGDLLLQTADGQVQMQKPVVYQLIDGARHEVAGNYVLRNRQTVGFEIAAYDHTAPLVIDPVLVYSTFLGGAGQDSGSAIAVDSAGNAYVSGEAGSANFPTLNSNQAFSGTNDAYVTKFNATGSALIYSTFLGGNTGFEHGYAIAVDIEGFAYVVGHTIAPDFPTTANALQPTKLTGGSQDTAFFTKLSPAGTLAYSTYLSGSQSSRGFGVATDGAGNAYVVGQAGTGFPVTANAFNSTNTNGGFLTKLNTNASGAASLVYSTFLGPTGFAEPRAVAVDATGNAYLAGFTGSTSTNFTSPGAFQTTYGGGIFDAFVIKFNTNLSGAASRVYSTYLGGSLADFAGSQVARGSQAIAIDVAGNAYVTGQTTSTNFPTANAFQPANGGSTDAFLTKLNPSGSALIYSTYLGGSSAQASPDEGRAVAVNVVGNAYVTGLAQSPNFPTANPVIPVSTTGTVFVAKFTPAGNALVYSTRLGVSPGLESGNGIALDSAGNAFVTGDARNGYPTTASAFQVNPGGNTDAFVSQIADPTIIGRVVDEDGNPIPAATVNLTGVPSATTTTDANGYFTFGLLTVANNYTVSVSVPNHNFNSQVVNNLQNNVRLDFDPVLVSISGRVTLTGTSTGVSGVTMSLTGGKILNAETNGSGNYSFDNLPAGRSYTVTPSKTGLTFVPTSQTFNSISINQTANFTSTATVNISGRATDGNSKPISGVAVTLSGTLTRVVQTDANGNYSFNNLAGGGNYSVIASSPFYVFAPPRFDFTNLSVNQTANFDQVPQAVPSPTPSLSDDFNGAQRDPQKWNLGTATQPAGAFDPQLKVVQINGQLVIAPLSNVSGLHYNGYVSVNAFDLTGGSASLEVVQPAPGGAETIFAIGSDPDNFFRFVVNTPSGSSGSPTMVKGPDGVKLPLDTTVAQLVFQVKVNGQLTSLSINYDPVQHRFMRFRHELPTVSSPNGAIVLETSPDNINFTVQQRVVLDKGVSPMAAELSAGTSSPTNPGQAVFDNFSLTTSTFQFSAGSYTVGEADGSVLITVTRASSTADAGSVDYATADGTALQGTKYIQTTGKLTFAAGETSKTFSVPIVDNALAEGNQTLDLVLSNSTGSGLNSPGRAVLTIIDNETVLTAGQAEIKTWTFQGRTYAYLKLLFPNAGYRVANWGQATSAGNDFSADAVVEKITGASVQAVTTTAQIYDLGTLSPGSYNFTFKNSGTVVKTLAFTVAAPPFPPNPIDNAREFVKQQYRDFLNREADQAGEDFWTDNITKCSDPARRPPDQTEAQCTLRQRETTSGAFFLSPEFQYTGYYVYRMYQGGLGRQPKLSEFIPDAQFVGAGILVNSQLSGAKINQNKADYAQQFVNCTDPAKYRCLEFKAIYDGLSNQQYVDKLFQTTGVNASAADRAALVNGLNANPATETRASVLQKVVDGIVVISEGNQQFTTSYGQAFYNSESNRAFVQLEYFGYMKRDPDDAGYAFWLGKLNQFGGNFVAAEMVLAFISSPEYRARFGQP